MFYNHAQSCAVSLCLTGGQGVGGSSPVALRRIVSMGQRADRPRYSDNPETVSVPATSDILCACIVPGNGLRQLILSDME